MVQFDYTIKDDLGIHARPAGVLVKAATKYECEITIAKGEKQTSAKKLFGLMGMSVKNGDNVTVACDGPDEEAACTELRQIFETIL